ncbi:hypothetical protein BN2537_10833 [Streptomyces venezuelae]|nr:hypothetical protein BN2537_10833 [Streptomyces venezuelae]
MGGGGPGRAVADGPAVRGEGPVLLMTKGPFPCRNGPLST